MKFPRVGVVGAGGLASKQIYPNLAEAGLKLAAVCDLRLDKARARADQYGGAAYDDMDRMIDGVELDGVIVCVGPEFHAVAAARVLETGLPVYTEKPPAINAEALWPVVELAREKRLVAMTAMKKRYAGVYQRARAFVLDPRFGRPQHLQMFRVSMKRWANESPRTDHLLDYCVHNIDLVTYLFGPIERVQASAVGKQAYQITAHFENGAIGSLSFVERPRSAPTETVELTGSDAWVSVWDQCGYRIGAGGAIIEVSDANFTTAGADGGAITGHRRELEAFAAALRDGTRPASHVDESYHTMCVYDAIVRAVESGDPEAVNDRLRSASQSTEGHI